MDETELPRSHAACISTMDFARSPNVCRPFRIVRDERMSASGPSSDLTHASASRIVAPSKRLMCIRLEPHGFHRDNFDATRKLSMRQNGHSREESSNDPVGGASGYSESQEVRDPGSSLPNPRASTARWTPRTRPSSVTGSTARKEPLSERCTTASEMLFEFRRERDYRKPPHPLRGRVA